MTDEEEKAIARAYDAAGHRVQTAIAMLMNFDPDYQATQPKHLRVGVDMEKADMAGVVTLLIEKGIFTKDEYLKAILKSAIDEANSYETQLQAVLGHRGVSTR